jgi:hypothetical protein
MDNPINIEKISDLNELKAGDRYTQVNFKSYSYGIFYYGIGSRLLSCESRLLSCERFDIAKKSLSRTISYMSSDYVLIQECFILLNVEFEK